MSTPVTVDPKLLKATKKAYRSIRKDMKTIKEFIDAASGTKEPDDAEDVAEAAQPNGNGAAHDPSLAPTPAVHAEQAASNPLNN